MNPRTIALFVLLISSICAAAMAGPPPDEVVSKMTEQVLFDANQVKGPSDLTKVQALVQSVILPNVNFASMTAHAVGIRWRTATDAQKSQLMVGFQSLLVKTYAGAFSQVQDAQFKLKGVRPIDAETTEVRSEVRANGSPDPIIINYRMALEGGDWKVTDVSVAGVWLVAAYRSQFSQVLEGGDIDGLIRVLDEKARVR